MVCKFKVGSIVATKGGNKFNYMVTRVDYLRRELDVKFIDYDGNFGNLYRCCGFDLFDLVNKWEQITI